MKVLDRVPWRAGSAWKSGACSTVKPGPEVRQLGRHGADEHVPDEQRVPRVRRDEPDRQPVGRIGAAEEVLHEQLARVEVGADVLVQPVERLGIEPGVLLPPDPVGRAGSSIDELVLGGAAGVGRGDGGERAVVGQLAFAAAERVFDERGRRQVGMDADREEAMLDEGEALARDCARLGTHTLLGACARQKDSAGDGAGRRQAGSIGKLPARGNPEREGQSRQTFRPYQAGRTRRKSAADVGGTRQPESALHRPAQGAASCTFGVRW